MSPKKFIPLYLEDVSLLMKRCSFRVTKIYTHYTFEQACFKRDLKTLWPLFLWMGFNCLKATATSRRQFTFYHSVPRNSWYSFYRLRKDERLNRSWSHPVVLSTGPLDWESSALTTRPLLHTVNISFLLSIDMWFD